MGGNLRLLIFGLLWSIVFVNSSGAAERVRVGYSSITGQRIPFWVAQEAKLFERHGLDVEALYIPSGTTSVQALIAGEVQILSTSGATAVAAALRGADLVLLGSMGVLEYKLLALPNIRSPQELKGKRVGVSRYGSFADISTRRILRYLGLNPEKDVTILQTGLSRATQRVLSMFDGGMDATLAQTDDILVVQLKLGKDVSVLGSLKETGYHATGSDIVTTRRFLRDQAETAKRFLMALCEGIQISRSRKDLVLRILRKQLREQNPRILEAQYQSFVVDTIPRKPYADEAAVRVALEDLERDVPGAKNKNPKDFVDGTLMEAIDRSGFIDRLYK